MIHTNSGNTHLPRDAYGGDNSKASEPNFSLRMGSHGHYWICDGDEKIAIFGPGVQGGHDYSLGLFRQCPGQSVPSDWLIEPEVLHFVTRQGLGLTTHWMNSALANIPPTLTVDESDRSCLRLRLVSTKSQAEHGTITITFRLESDPRRYVVDVEYDLTLQEKGGGEFCNFYPHGAGDFRPDRSKYNQILWEDSRGNAHRHWLSVILPQPGPIELGAHGFFAYLDETDGNPAIRYESCDPLVKTEMCLCWFDNHMIWTEPPDRSAPPYHYHAKLKAYWMTRTESLNLKAGAEEVSLQPFAGKWNGYVPVRMGTVNDFERRADLIKPAVKTMYVPVGDKPDSPIVWDDKVGHSGTHSLRFQLERDGEIDECFWGPELLVTPGKQVYISAWIKAEAVKGDGFWLQTAFGRWDGRNGNGTVAGPFSSESITGTVDWRQISIPLPPTPPNAEWLDKRIRFRFKGSGKVWLDDLRFEER